ncbi:MAG: TraR/DksA C4-type zinc finger protein [Verrucomicrobiales bacterium]|jgi:RNA polymerase-binding transcription factor DksA|nr:TraR/DksA C4-type zinc finger protein [Verrucomicrobiales bacterium]
MPKNAVKTKQSKVVKVAQPVKKTVVKKSSAKPAKAKVPAPKKPAKPMVPRKPVRPSAKAKSGKVTTVSKPNKGNKGKVTKPVFGKPPFPIKSPKIISPGASNAIIKPAKNRSLSVKFLTQQRKKLIDLREHMVNQMQGVAHTNLNSPGDDSQVSAFGMHQADAGSDAYEKDFALSLLSQEQDALYEINAALKRIDSGTYGVCEMSGQPIPVNRLEATPFARFTIECQSQIEKEQKGHDRWETNAQFMDNVETFYEEEEETDDEDSDKLKLKE